MSNYFLFCQFQIHTLNMEWSRGVANMLLYIMFGQNITTRKLVIWLANLITSYLNLFHQQGRRNREGKNYIDGRTFYQTISSFKTYRKATYVYDVTKDCLQNNFSQNWYNLSQESHHWKWFNLQQQE